MSFLPDLLTKLKNLAEKISSGLKIIPEKLREMIQVPGKGKFVFIGLGAFAVLLIGLIAVLLVINHTSSVRLLSPEELGGVPQAVIPPEELFLPGEPDILPGVLLEREQRKSWTAEDSAPYWQDPLKNGEEQWRERVEAVIDDLMERVL
jgi:hypothetical protein